MFVDTAFARRIELAEASLSSDVGRCRLAHHPHDTFVEPIAGGVAVFSGADAPVNKVIGVGFGDPPDEGLLDAIEARYAAFGAHVQAELSTLADPAWHAALSRRGYVLAGFEHVLGLDLSCVPPRTATTSGVSVVECEAASGRTWIETVATGFQFPDDVPAAASGQDFPREVIERVFEDLGSAGGFRRYLAFVDGVVAGGASLREHDGIAQMCGAATLPAFRRRGVQSALLDARLHDARARGHDVAIVTTAPGSKSQQNVQRRGFSLLYARALHVKTPGRTTPSHAGT